MTLKLLFEEDAALRELDGARYLGRLAQAAETIINAAEYGRIVHDLALKRGLIKVGEDAVNRAFDRAPPETRPRADRDGRAASCSRWRRRANRRASSAPSRRC